MNIKIGSFVISKPVWIRLGLIILLVGLPVVLGLHAFYIPAVSFPAILLASRATQQFRIDNGYADDDEAPEH